MTDSTTDHIAANIRSIQDKIAAVQADYPVLPDTPNPQHVTLIAVSKQQPEEKIEAALSAGQRHFGENRLQEAQQRWNNDRRARFPDLCLHLIGALQTNKAREAVALFDVIHSVDREKLARILGQEMAAQNRKLPCFIQVNTGMEDQKSGITPDDLANFLAFCRKECVLDIIGLMCLPPVDEPPALHFAFLRKLAETHGLSQLSMGMSDDYERAVPLGATHIRVGTGVFGARAGYEG
ncbi:MAG: YggS family pyridoxal phosphate-dependent enzyme [Alphaproteobacteria bacterium]